VGVFSFRPTCSSSNLRWYGAVYGALASRKFGAGDIEQTESVLWLEPARGASIGLRVSDRTTEDRVATPGASQLGRGSRW
jgi:hypothetical protein